LERRRALAIPMRRPERDRVFLFQYGSNMSPDRLNSCKRLNGQAIPISAAALDGWGIRFDPYSTTNRSAVTDILPASGEHVMGILFDVPESAVDIMDRIEGVCPDGTGNYKRGDVVVKIIPEGEGVNAITYVGTSAGRERFGKQPVDRQVVTPAYFEHLLDGARQFNFTEEYIAYLKSTARLP
jgi:hypothetical protein